MIKPINRNMYQLSEIEEREIELANQWEEMRRMQIKLDNYTQQETYDYDTAKNMLMEIQKLYRIYEAEELFGTTAEEATIH